MITFSHGGKLFSVGPSELFINSHKFNILEELTVTRYDNNNSSGKPLNIDGVLHSLYETPSAKYNVQPAEGTSTKKPLLESICNSSMSHYIFNTNN